MKQYLRHKVDGGVFHLNDSTKHLAEGDQAEWEIVTEKDEPKHDKSDKHEQPKGK